MYDTLLLLVSKTTQISLRSHFGFTTFTKAKYVTDQFYNLWLKVCEFAIKLLRELENQMLVPLHGTPGIYLR